VDATAPSGQVVLQNEALHGNGNREHLHRVAQAYHRLTKSNDKTRQEQSGFYQERYSDGNIDKLIKLQGGRKPSVDNNNYHPLEFGCSGTSYT
jgi:hypothetical protein